MRDTGLSLPTREDKPRCTGMTILIDNGLPLGHFEDVIESFEDVIDLVKFGWGTSVVTRPLEEKIGCLQAHKVDFFFGGTLFEKYVAQNKVERYHEYLQQFDCRYVEISNGTIELSNRTKAQFISEFAKDFTVLSEVGYKDDEKSIHLNPAKWIEYMQEDLSAGAAKVITEARESGSSGICRSNGELRYGLIDEIIQSDIDSRDIIFEAPNKTLQTYFICLLGANVNLANVPFQDAIALETLRLGLRSDTLLQFETH